MLLVFHISFILGIPVVASPLHAPDLFVTVWLCDDDCT